MDEATLEVRGVEITSSNVGDAPVLPDLLWQVLADEPIASVTADRAYDTRACHDAIAGRGAEAIVPPRRNAKPWKRDSPGAGARNEALRAIKGLGRTIWHRWRGDLRRSRAESKMNCMRLFGQELPARDFDRQKLPGPDPGLPNSKSAPPSSTATPPSASPSPSPSADLGGGKGEPPFS